MPRERRLSIASGIVLGFVLAVVVLGLLGAIGPFEFILAWIVFSAASTLLVRPLVHRRLDPGRGDAAP